MTFELTETFLKRFERLPVSVQRRVREKLSFWRENAYHPSLRFKKVASNEPVWSLRVNYHCRMLGKRTGDHMQWYWVGPYGDYDKLLKRLR